MTDDEGKNSKSLSRDKKIKHSEKEQQLKEKT
jgi:hypothetical protein